MTPTTAASRQYQPATTAREVRATVTPVTVVSRLMHRADRHEGGTHTPVRVVVARPPVGMLAPSPVVAPPGLAAAFTGSRTRLPMPEASPSPDHGGIDRLTDEILRQLDRRLVATRERMGTR